MTSPRVWFITGASTGFGRSITEFVLNSGDIAVATLRKPEVLADLVARHPKERLLVVKLDVQDSAQITNAFSKAKEAFGRIDVVFNNAGVGLLGEAEAVPEDFARRIFDVNFWGAANVSRAAVQFFRDVNRPVGGTLLQVTSIATYESWPGLGYYSASKHALHGFSEALAKELDPSWNIKVTNIAPGGFNTQGNKESMTEVPTHPAYTDPSLPSLYIRREIPHKTLDGDPNKAAKAIYKFVDQSDRPINFPLGKDSIESARRAIATLTSDINKVEAYSEDLNLDELESK